MITVMVFSVVIGKVCWSTFPLKVELLLGLAAFQSVESHVHGLWCFRNHCLYDEAMGSSIIGGDDFLGCWCPISLSVWCHGTAFLQLQKRAVSSDIEAKDTIHGMMAKGWGQHHCLVDCCHYLWGSNIWQCSFCYQFWQITSIWVHSYNHVADKLSDSYMQMPNHVIK